jgi:uncharacterized membrane protein
MNNHRKRLYAAALSAVLAGLMGPALTAGADGTAQRSSLEQQVDEAIAPSQSLEGVVVTPGNNPLLRSDQHLAMLSASLPLDAQSGAAQPTDLQRVAALFPGSPDAATGEARRMMERSRAPASPN